MSAAELRAVFGGTWDGGAREIHGLIEREGVALKIELLRASNWCCSIFLDGQCVSQGRAASPREAVDNALMAWRT